MAIYFKNNINIKGTEPPKEASSTTSGGIRNIADLVKREQAAVKTPVKRNQSFDRSKIDQAQKSNTINNNIIKPKYVEDQSVVYKASGYMKDLIGEGN